MVKALENNMVAVVAIVVVLVIFGITAFKFRAAFTMAADIISLVSIVLGVIGTITGAVFGVKAGAQAGVLAGASERDALRAERDALRGAFHAAAPQAYGQFQAGR